MKNYRLIEHYDYENTCDVSVEYEGNLKDCLIKLTGYLEQDHGKEGDSSGFSVYIMDEDDNEIIAVTLYDEGETDRKQYKGEYGVFYWYEAGWSANEQELVYNLYFQQEFKETIKSSDMKNWYWGVSV